MGLPSLRSLLRRGAKVLIATRTKENGENTLAQIVEAGGQGALLAVDIGDQEAIKGVVDAAVGKWGRLDITLYNAASFLGGPVKTPAKVA